jgi:hypothetical protein
MNGSNSTRQRIMRHARALRCALAVTCRLGLAIALGLTWTATAGADAIRIAVDADQRVTISGSSDSLRATLAEICAQARVELRAFEASDRPFRAEYDSIPLAEAVSRLLRSEVFIAGMRPDRDGRGARVSWLRVSGSNRGAASVAPMHAVTTDTHELPVASGFDFGPNPRLVQTALSSKDPTARGRAREAILSGLRDDPSVIQRFVDRDVDLAAEELAAFAYSAEFLRALQTATTHPDERAQVQRMLARVQVRQARD